MSDARACSVAIGVPPEFATTRSALLLEPGAATHDIGGVSNDPRVQRAIQIVLVLLFVSVAGSIALAAALLRG